MAESLDRHWIAGEAVEEYRKDSAFRFDDIEKESDVGQVRLFE